MEIRLKDIKLDYDSEHKKIGGYINVVERSSETLYSSKKGKWFKETMRAGVFTRALQKNNAIPLLLEHDWDKQVAHTGNGTLELREDNIGLRFDAVVSEEDFQEIREKGITSCSFGFKVNEEQCEPVNPKLEKRYVSNIDLYEVSLVANPAYVGSLVEQRNMEKALEELEEEQKEVEIEQPEEVEEVREKSTDSQEKQDEEVNNEKDSSEDEEVDNEKTETSDKEHDEDKEERNVEVPTYDDSNVIDDAKEVIDTVIEETQATAEMYGDMAKNTDEYKQMVIEDTKEIVNSLENESLYYSSIACQKWLEVAKLKQISMNL